MKRGIRLGQKLSIKPKLKMVGRIRFASFIKLGEGKFAEYIAEVEQDPVFKKLLSVDNAERRVVTCKSFPKTVFETSNLSIEEQISGDKSSVDVESLLQEKNGVAALIKKIGLEKFEKYFLRCETACQSSEICRECGITEKDAERVNSFINDLSVRSEFYHPSGLALESRLNYSKIAEIEYDGKSDFVINFFSPRYLSGRYVVNSVRLNALKKQNAFSKEETVRLGKLLEKIHLINSRKSTIYQILKNIIEVQKNYLYSGDDKFLVPYTQKKLAEDIGMDKSVVCRAIYGRSVLTPHKVEKPLKFFVTRKKTIRKTLVKKIIESEPRRLTDEKIRQFLKDKFNLDISRRSVNVYRNEILRKKRGLQAARTGATGRDNGGKTHNTCC